ncbi:unnamed protein product [Orchesella dallaii]|uniref:C2H2-type domain-containing protein n=1 Tax=Orchesella dallaii TaxID=48710 RepID=A0ABP1PHZ6_9HEXA
MWKLVQIGFSCGGGTKECGTDEDKNVGQCQVPCENGQGQTKFTKEVVELESKPNERDVMGQELVDLGALGEGQLFGGQLENHGTTAPYKNDIDLSDYLDGCTTFDVNFFDDIICLEEEPPHPQIPTETVNLLEGNKKCSEGIEIGMSTITTGVSDKGDEGLDDDLAKILDEFYPPLSTEAEVELAETVVEIGVPESVVAVGNQVVSIPNVEISSWPECQEYLEQKLREAKIMQEFSGAVTASGGNETLGTTSNLKRGNDKDEELQPPLKKRSGSDTTETQRTDANKNLSKQKQLNVVPPEENSQSGIGQVKTTGGSGSDAALCEVDFKVTNQENFSSCSGFSSEVSNGPVAQYECCLLCPLPSILPEGGLVIHLLQVHSSNNQCPYCVKRFNAQNLLRMHLQSFHKLGPEYKCPICAKPFYGKPTPLRHLWTHKSADEMKEAKGHGEKIPAQMKNKFNISKNPKLSSVTKPRRRPVPEKKMCEICGKWLKNLTGHKRQCHTKMEERYFVCTICKEHPKFVTNSRLRQHKLSAHGVGKKLKCGDCPEMFTCSVMRKAHHDRVHAKTPPLKCPHCDKVFSWKTSWRRHIKLVHKTEDVRKKEETCLRI